MAVVREEMVVLVLVQLVVHAHAYYVLVLEKCISREL